MTYDAARQCVVDVQGMVLPSKATVTASWNGKTWTAVNLRAAPSLYAVPTITYDTTRKLVLLFGGGPQLNETWLWDGKTWTNANPPSSPSGLGQTAVITYDSARQQALLIGTATSGSQIVTETWLWDGKTWTKAKPTKLPPPNTPWNMAFDSVRNNVVLYGGSSGTWLWNGKDWQNASSSASPSYRQLHGMAFSGLHNQVALFGGEQQGDKSEMWLWTGTGWNRVAPTFADPSRRQGIGMAYDQARKQIVVYGGYVQGLSKETWVYGALPKPVKGSFQPYGASCGHPPQLSMVPGPSVPPVIGQGYWIKIDNPPTGANYAVMAGGTSKTRLGPITLPLSLTPFGMPGCNLYQSMDWIWQISFAGGYGAFNFVIPNDSNLLGASLHLQALVPAPKTNAMQVISSHGASVLFGNY